MDDLDIRHSWKMATCHDCRAAMMTFYTEERQSNGTWKVIKLVRNCGHTTENDPK